MPFSVNCVFSVVNFWITSPIFNGLAMTTSKPFVFLGVLCVFVVKGFVFLDISGNISYYSPMNAVPKPRQGYRAWTDAQRAEQAAKLHARKIWLNSTGPRTAHGKSISCLNALKHGGTSRPAKAFMAHFRNYQALLHLAFQRKRELLQIQKNELIALNNKKRPNFAFSGVLPKTILPFPPPPPPKRRK